MPNEPYIILGDLYARVGARSMPDDEWEFERGPHGFDEVNEAGRELLAFLSLNEATIYIMKRDINKYTWKQPKMCMCISDKRGGLPHRPPVTVHQSEHQPFCRNYRERFQDKVSTKLRSHRPSPESGILLKEKAYHEDSTGGYCRRMLGAGEEEATGLVQ